MDATLPVDGAVGLTRLRHGPMLYLRNDRPIATALEAYGEWSDGEIQLLTPWLRPGDTVVEAGANIGTHTIPLAQRVGPGGRVVSIEAQRMMFQLLCGNLAINKLFNVDVRHAAASDAPGTIDIPLLPFASGPNNYSAAPMAGASDNPVYAGCAFEPVPAVSVDSLGLASVRLIKMDVEGMEPAVLRGAEGVIARDRPILYLEADRPGNFPALAEWLRAHAYQAWWHIVPIFEPDNIRGQKTDLTGGLVSVNIACLPVESDLAPPASRQSFLDYVDTHGGTAPRLVGGRVQGPA